MAAAHSEIAGAAAIGRAARDLAQAASARAGAAVGKWRPMLALLVASGRFLERAAAAGVGNLGGSGRFRGGGLSCPRQRRPPPRDPALRRLPQLPRPRLPGLQAMVRPRLQSGFSAPILRHQSTSCSRVLCGTGEETCRVRQRLVLMPRSDELEAVVRRVRSDLEQVIFDEVMGCWNGCIHTRECFSAHLTLWWPLHLARARLQPPPVPEKPTSYYLEDIFPSSNDCGQIFNLHLWGDGDQTTADV